AAAAALSVPGAGTRPAAAHAARRLRRALPGRAGPVVGRRVNRRGAGGPGVLSPLRRVIASPAQLRPSAPVAHSFHPLPSVPPTLTLRRSLVLCELRRRR